MSAFSSNDPVDVSGLISSRKFLNFQDFEMGIFLQEGGYGKVYAATRKSDGLRVAMKFFGYTRQKPDVDEIRKEVALMIRLDKGVAFVDVKEMYLCKLIASNLIFCTYYS